jgi:putative membrane protein
MRILLISCFLFLGIAAQAQQAKKAPAKKSTTKKSTAAKASSTKPVDGSVIMKAYYGDLLEIELGGYAEKYAASQRVKDFGSMMVRDHRRTKAELKSIASNRNMTISETMDASHKAKADAMENKKGEEFDKQYMAMMISDHTKDLAELRKASGSVRDADLKKFMPRALTLMQTHLDSARAVQAAIGGGK